MQSVMIYLRDAQEVWNFVNTMRKFNGAYDLAVGSYTVDAKSVLGVCALGTRKELELMLVDPKGEEREVLNAVSRYAQAARQLHQA